jgi:hypothetical protein
MAIYLAKTESSQKIQTVTDMICISCAGICGEDDFRYLWEEKARTPRVNERNSAGQQAIIEGYIAKGHIQVKLV